MLDRTEELHVNVVSVVDCIYFSSRRRHTRLQGDWSSDVCSSDLGETGLPLRIPFRTHVPPEHGLHGARMGAAAAPGPGTACPVCAQRAAAGRAGAGLRLFQRQPPGAQLPGAFGRYAYAVLDLSAQCLRRMAGLAGLDLAQASVLADRAWLEICPVGIR